MLFRSQMKLLVRLQESGVQTDGIRQVLIRFGEPTVAHLPTTCGLIEGRNDDALPIESGQVRIYTRI